MPAIDPYSPCPDPPGSEGRILWLQARAALRLPLFDLGGQRQVDYAQCAECGRLMPQRDYREAGRRKYCSAACQFQAQKRRDKAALRARALALALASQPG